MEMALEVIIMAAVAAVIQKKKMCRRIIFKLQKLKILYIYIQRNIWKNLIFFKWIIIMVREIKCYKIILMREIKTIAIQWYYLQADKLIEMKWQF